MEKEDKPKTLNIMPMPHNTQHIVKDVGANMTLPAAAIMPPVETPGKKTEGTVIPQANIDPRNKKITNSIPVTTPVDPDTLEKLIPAETLEIATQAITEGQRANADQSMQDMKSMQEAHARNVRDCYEMYYLETPKSLNFVLYVVVAFFVIFLIWAKFTVIDETTEGFGEVVPSSKIQVIQNLEGGIVSALHVKEGDIVKKGSKLVTLSSTLFGASYQEQYEKYLSLLGNIARLNAQVNMLDQIVFPEELNNQTDIREQEQRLFNTNMNSINSETRSLEASLNLVKNEIQIISPLVKSGLMSQLDHIKLEKERKEIERQIEEKKMQFIGNSHAELNAKHGDISSLAEQLKGLHDRMSRTIIKSPIGGVVHNLRVNTIGGVITPGMEIVDIVPMEDSLLVEAKVRPMDIAFIHPGQDATVKVTAYDYSIYGGLQGKVVNISPDTVSDEKNNKFYKISVKTEKNFLGKDSKPLPIIPGMMVTVHILTGKKSIMKYIFKPVINISEDAFRER